MGAPPIISSTSINRRGTPDLRAEQRAWLTYSAAIYRGRHLTSGRQSRTSLTNRDIDWRVTNRGGTNANDIVSSKFRPTSKFVSKSWLDLVPCLYNIINIILKAPIVVTLFSCLSQSISVIDYLAITTTTVCKCTTKLFHFTHLKNRQLARPRRVSPTHKL